MNTHYPTSRWLRKAYKISNIVGTALLIASFALSVIPPQLVSAQVGAGAIWTTNETCLDPAAQDDNAYMIGETVHIRGEGFVPNTPLDYWITGQPGGASSDPGLVVASGTSTTDANGKFCVAAYTIPLGDRGTYTVDVQQGTNIKNDNYRVDGILEFELQVSKTASTSYVRTWEWEIDKEVDQAYWELLVGESADPQYTVSLDKVGYTDSDWEVHGSITVYNPAPWEAKIAGVTDVVSPAIVAQVSCGVTWPYTLGAGQTLTCSYAADLPDGTSRTNQATANVTADSYVLPGSGTADVLFGDPGTEVNTSVTVTDTRGGDLGSFSDDGSASYSETFACSAVGSTTYPNTATIDQTGQFASASVTVACGQILPLVINKTAVPTFTRTYEWTIDKSVTPTSLNMFSGQSGTVDYTIAIVQTGFTDSAWAVSGEIQIQNPSTFTALISEVTDVMTGGIAASVICPATSIPAGGTMTCTYSSELPNGTARTNTASVTATTEGFDTSGSDTAEVVFSTPTTEVNKTINVTDTYNGGAWQFSESGSVTYQRTFTCDADEDSYDNTATIVQTGQSDSVTLPVVCNDLPVLTISKTANTAWTRTFEWAIDKVVDDDLHELFVSESAVSNYDVTVTKSAPIDSGWTVAGVITVSNDTAYGATIASITDTMTGYGEVPLTCEELPDHRLPAGEDWTCTYQVVLPSAPIGDLLNTVTVVTAPGDAGDDIQVQGGTANAVVSFSATPTYVIGDEIDVIDSFAGALGSDVSATTTFEYARTFTCEAPGSFNYPNTASIVGTTLFDTADVDVVCDAIPPLVVRKTALTSYTLTYPWSIVKSVDPEAHDLWAGNGPGTSTYTIEVTRGEPVASDWAVEGVITILNPEKFDAIITGVTDLISGTIPGAVSCPVSFPYILEGFDTLTCTYSADLPDGGARTNVATVTVDEDSLVPGASGSASVGFGEAEVTEVNPEISVDDTFGLSWDFSDSGTVTYERTFTCSIEQGESSYTVDNTATIVETGQSDSAQVTVNCDPVPALVISKSADTTFTRTWNWDIVKSVAPDAWTMVTGQSGTSTYTVAVTRLGYLDSAWQVSGEITITNPSIFVAQITSISDLLSEGSAAEIDCGEEFSLPYDLAGGASLVCDYAVDLAAAPPAELTNTASVVTEGLVEGSLITIPVTFGEPAVEINAEIDVSDTNGMGWQFADSGLVTYTKAFTCDADEGSYTNVATIVQTGQNDDAVVVVACDPVPTTPTPTQETPVPTLAPPESTAQVLIPVTGAKLPNPFKSLSLLFFQFGLAAFGLGLVFKGLSKREF